MGIYISTKRLKIRQFSPDDANQLYKICNQPYILKWMPDWETSLDDIERWISQKEKRYSQWTKDNVRIMLAVTLEKDGKVIGMVGIGNKVEVDNEVEIAYFISEEYSNQGYMSEAAKAMTKWAFDNVKLDYLIAIVEPDNSASQKVVERCGFNKIKERMILNSGESEEKPFYYYRLYNS
ncbi:GNAT family N-acetyltransferase [Desulfosporosinus sp. PR]|uniref:GNAT family N-acetyltransferase n=1 Tax=Candidatus Desulfosporosinus nitrosoreducens TaxID=3401928 RepID=UPI0027F4F80E|nr:GNAT family N-acetyltransferase [Desulfosporosinus sp. PR]MDQ7096647.1 GNAT family N-acetyltransferase [Desulfosporosinus sp. PR]